MYFDMHYIQIIIIMDGQVLFTLTKSDLVEMIPSIGLVKNILSITDEQSVRIHTL